MSLQGYLLSFGQLVWKLKVESLGLFIKPPGCIYETQVVTQIGRIMTQHQEIIHASLTLLKTLVCSLTGNQGIKETSTMNSLHEF